MTKPWQAFRASLVAEVRLDGNFYYIARKIFRKQVLVLLPEALQESRFGRLYWRAPIAPNVE